MIKYPQLRHEFLLRVATLTADDYADQLRGDSEATGISVEHRFSDDLNDIFDLFESPQGFDAQTSVGVILQSAEEADVVQMFIDVLERITRDGPTYAVARTRNEWKEVVSTGRRVLDAIGT